MDNVRQYSLIAFLATFRDNALVMFIGTWFQILAAFTEKLLSDTFLREASSNTLHKLGLSCLLLSMNCLNKMAISFRFPMVWFGMVRTTAIDIFQNQTIANQNFKIFGIPKFATQAPTVLIYFE